MQKPGNEHWRKGKGNRVPNANAGVRWEKINLDNGKKRTAKRKKEEV